MRSPRSLVAACLLGLLTAPACSLHQARATQRTAEVVAATALGVMIASIVASAAAPGHDALADVGLACIPVALLGVGVYIGADLRASAEDERAATVVRPVPSPTTELANRRARELGHEAAAAARIPDCDEVRQLEERIGQLDPNVRAASLRSARIQACVGGGSSGAEPGPGP